MSKNVTDTILNQDDTTIVTNEDTITNTVTTVEDTAEKMFSQEDLNKIVSSRVNKERDSFAKELGIGDKYSKESFNSFIEANKTMSTEFEGLKEVSTSYNTKIEEMQEALTQKQTDLYKYQHGVEGENLTKAMKLSELEIEANADLTMDQALEKVLTDFPNLKTIQTTVPKVGSPVTNSTKVDPNPYITTSLQNQFPWLKK